MALYSFSAFLYHRYILVEIEYILGGESKIIDASVKYLARGLGECEKLIIFV